VRAFEEENPATKDNENETILPKPPPLHTLTGHSDIVRTVAFHPKYELLASGNFFFLLSGILICF